MEEELSLKEMQKTWHGTKRSYTIGLSASFLLTGLSFFLVVESVLPKNTLMITIAALAFVQAVFQLLFFLHVGQEAKPRWETGVFFFMLLILLIIVLGSLWVMFNLNERTMGFM